MRCFQSWRTHFSIFSSPIFSIACLLFTLLGLSSFSRSALCFAQAKKAPLSVFEIELYKLGLIHRQEAETKLLTSMEDVADWVVQFKLRFGHYPDPGTEEDQAREYLQSKVVKANPYVVAASLKAGELVPPCPIKFRLDGLLTQRTREQWEKKAPETWKEEPGTITIITNGEKCVLVWGATSDRMPIIDEKSHSNKFAWREFN